MSSFVEFIRLCNDQEAELDDRIVKAGYTHSSARRSLEPNGLYSAIVEAGRLLRKRSNAPLAKRFIDGPWHNSGQHYLAAHTLAAIINASIEPPTTHVSEFSSNNVTRIDTCPEAEVNFAYILAQMRQPDTPLRNSGRSYGYQIITDQTTNIAIGVRKGSGLPSTLTFTDITIDGIPYPAGSILRAEIIDDAYELQGPALYPRVPPYCQTSIGHERVSGAAFMRVSAFAAEPGQERLAFLRHLPLKEHKDSAPILEILQDTPMSEITRIAQTALQSTAELTCV